MLGKFKNFFSVGIVGATLGCFSVTLLPTVAHAAEMIKSHGGWHGFVANQADEAGFGISSGAGDGGTIALVVRGDDVALMLISLDWRMKVGENLPVRVTIDGENYDGDALVVKAGTVRMSRVSNDLVLRPAHGNQTTIEIGKNGLAWKVSLDGFAATLQDTVKAYVGHYV